MVPLTAVLVSFLWSWKAPDSRLAALASDDPSGDDLKVHEQPTPPIGGLGIYLALIPAFVQVGDPITWIAASGALALGVVDDRRSLSPRSRLAVEILIGLLLAASPAVQTWQARFVIFAATVVLINAVNLYDGLDGLVGGTLAVSAVGVGVLADSVLATSLAGALVGFLAFNWHPAKLFLGDGGAYLVAVVVVASARLAEPSDPAALLLLLGMSGVVLVDLAVTLIRRRRAGVPLFIGDRSHIYDQLRDRGWSVPAVAILSIVAQIAIAAVAGLSFTYSSEWMSVAIVSSLLAGVAVLAGMLGFMKNEAPS